MHDRATIEAIAIGETEIAFCINDSQGEFKPVAEIFAKRDDIHGKLFACGYVQYTAGARMSFSVKEGDACDFRHVKIRQVGRPLTSAILPAPGLRLGRHEINEAI